MQYISTKQLRQVFPQVRAAIARGEEYILIHRSQPIARLVPLADQETDHAASSVTNVSPPHSPQQQSPDDLHITTHLLHKPMTLPTPVGYSHPVAFRHLKLDLKETVNLIKPK